MSLHPNNCHPDNPCYLECSEELFVCPTCKSVGFDKSILGDTRCTFCDGTVGGNPPTPEDL